MKCDELKPLVFSIRDLAYVDEPTPQPNFQNPHDHAVYKATEVDAAIAELKDEVKFCSDFENANLKQKLESVQASAYADSVDAGMRERRLKRALYKACANWALSTLAWLDCIDQGEPRKWSEMVQKCRKKAEEYK